MPRILINLDMLRCIQTKIQFPNNTCWKLCSFGWTKNAFHIFIHGGAQHFCRLKSHPNLYFESLTITPENFIEIKQHLLIIRSVKAIQGIHWALWETIQWPLISLFKCNSECTKYIFSFFSFSSNLAIQSISNEVWIPLLMFYLIDDVMRITHFTITLMHETARLKQRYRRCEYNYLSWKQNIIWLILLLFF